MVSKKRLIGLVIVLASLIVLPACAGAGTPLAPTIDSNMVYTAAVQTVQVGLTATAAARPSSTPEPTATETAVPVPPTPETQAALTQAPVAVNTTAPTAAGQRPVATTAAVGLAGDHGAWMSQSPADGTSVDAGTQFRVFWSIKNTGTTTWTTSYKLAQAGGTQLSGTTSVPVEKDVKPGEKAEFYTVGVAPTKAGKYTSYWKLYNSGGAAFYEVYINFTVK